MSKTTSSGVMRLGPEEVHLWYVCADRALDAALLESYESILSPEEDARRRRFVFEKDRHLNLLARALVRTTLSRYVSLPPGEWKFQENRYGKPSIAGPQIEMPLEFNLSHTRGMVVCAVTHGREVGVDVEHGERHVAALRLADRFFSAEEAAALKALPPEQQPERFLDYWTLKESYIKARGMGLALPLGAFTFHLEADRPVRITFGPEIEDDASGWQFEQLQPTPHHKVAVAVRRSSELELSLQARETVPCVP